MSMLVFGEDGAAIECTSPGTFDIACVDIFGNGGGDWLGCVIPYENVNAIFSENPQFCGPVGSGKFGLQLDSPCLADFNPCGLLVGPPPFRLEST